MGASLVKAAFEQFPDLPDYAMRALVYMAATAKDTDETPTYWEGRDALASSLGRAVVDLGGESTDVIRATQRKVDRAVRSLTVAKAITLINRPRRGTQAEYQLNLSMDRAGRGSEKDHAQRGAVAAMHHTRRGAVTGQVGRAEPRKHHATATKAPRHSVVSTTPSVVPRTYEDLLGKKTLGRNQLTDETPTADEPIDPSLSNVEDNTGEPAPPLRVVASNPSTPVVTAKARQPALWPAVVPDIKEDTVRADEARELAREALKGHSRRPITRAGRERERLAQGWQPARRGANAGALAPGEGDTPHPIAIADRKGFGFCWPCHDEGRVTLAADQVNGDRCERHMHASAVAS